MKLETVAKSNSLSHSENQDRMGQQPRISGGAERLSATRSGSVSRTVMVFLATCLFAFLPVATVHGQDSKPKVPIIGKLTSGNNQQAFTGKVQSLDLKQRVLNVNGLHGRDTEIFPIKKSVRVEALNGDKMKLTELAPGMTILIYFDQKSDERTVRNIIVLSSSKSQGKAKPAHSS